VYVVALQGEDFAQELASIRVIVDNQYCFRHVRKIT
jgi:hypothetical protein